jgi:2-polyprenyl-6-methoxyphenol hydroxylase-like FAD-dependent oxidoreductase
MNVLISGAGIAGLTLAYWLKNFGFEVAIVEKSPDLSHEGYMIDFYGSGFDVAEKMGIIERLRARHYPIPRLAYMDGQGRQRAALEIDKLRALLNYRHFNFMRGDLVQVLCEAIPGDVSLHFGTTITRLEQQPDGVQVILADGIRQTYDLVIGADGIHSRVRALVWGSESQFENYLGYIVSCGIIENFLDEPAAFYTHLAPGRQAAVYSIRGDRLATFLIFKSPRPNVDGRSTQFAALEDRFGEMDWVIPMVLSKMKTAERLYFDTASQINVAQWHQGRVALVGDACQCLTLVAGQGASMAMAGAYLLATALHEADGDYQRAFPAYQAQLKPEIDQRQVQAQKFANTFVPGSRFGIWLTYAFLRLAFLPGFRSFLLKQVGAKSIIH